MKQQASEKKKTSTTGETPSFDAALVAVYEKPAVTPLNAASRAAGVNRAGDGFMMKRLPISAKLIAMMCGSLAFSFRMKTENTIDQMEAVRFSIVASASCILSIT